MKKIRVNVTTAEGVLYWASGRCILGHLHFVSNNGFFVISVPMRFSMDEVLVRRRQYYATALNLRNSGFQIGYENWHHDFNSVRGPRSHVAAAKSRYLDSVKENTRDGLCFSKKPTQYYTRISCNFVANDPTAARLSSIRDILKLVKV